MLSRNATTVKACPGGLWFVWFFFFFKKKKLKAKTPDPIFSSDMWIFDSLWPQVTNVSRERLVPEPALPRNPGGDAEWKVASTQSTGVPH